MKSGDICAYPAPYGSYRTGCGWEASPALLQTDNMLQKDKYSAAKFVDLVNVLYAELLNMEADVLDNQEEFCRLIGINWLLPHEDPIEEDADKTKNWRCRDIDPQEIVIVGYKGQSNFDDPDCSFHLRNWREWRQLQLECGVPCYAYELKQAITDGRVRQETFVIGGESKSNSEKVWCVLPQYYNETIGLSFIDPEDENGSED